MQLELKTNSSSSKIYVGGKLKDAISLFPGRKVVLLVDENVIRFHGDSLPGVPVIPVYSGESSKSFDQVIRIYNELMKNEVDRNCAIIGIGGGITTDVAGFVASTFLRGISFGFVATTLLAQVDAAIGGKNGINLEGYKNMIGIIRQPEFVICDLEMLKTLDNKEFISGFAEIIKYGAIRNQDFFHYIESNIYDGINMKMEVLEKMVSESAKSKIEVVEKDEKESGERKTLNFGHTFAHAFEKLYKISHGEAVAIGMVLAAKLSVNLRLLHSSKADRLQALINKSTLPIHIDFDIDQVCDVMRRDKKRDGQEIKFILLEDIGKAIIKSISVNEINSILYDLR